ncbi:MAG: ribosomal RNA small subunit methyltransferase A [Fimbriimonadaceae bacterium]|nr:ribosomal RNA small subunit methyltransferase A [Fimbriimonadaceae bacterium]
MGPQGRNGPHLPGKSPTGRVAEVVARAKRHGLDPRKSLGQHFLVSPGHVSRIVDEARGLASVVEVGPGPATLTPGLVEAVGTVVAVDIDPRVGPILAEAAPEARFILADILEFNLAACIGTLPRPCGIVSNMPYNITGPLLDRVARVADSVDRAILMMQTEVARKVMALAGNSARGALSVLMQWDFEIALVSRVPAGAFYPPPKVESTVLRLTPRAARPDPRTRAIVRSGFAHPRKTLAHNLGWPRADILGLLEELDHPPLVRAHQLSQEDWQFLASKSPTP